MCSPLPSTVQGVYAPSSHNQRIHLFKALSVVPVEVQALLPAVVPVELHPAPNVLPFVFPVAALVAGT